jgi:hypothetical protein
MNKSKANNSGRKTRNPLQERKQNYRNRWMITKQKKVRNNKIRN